MKSDSAVKKWSNRAQWARDKMYMIEATAGTSVLAKDSLCDRSCLRVHSVCDITVQDSESHLTVVHAVTANRADTVPVLY